MNDAGARHVQADLDHEVFEYLPIFAFEDRLAVGADHFDVVLLQDAFVPTGHAGIEPRLPTQCRQERINGCAACRFADQNLFDRFGRNRLDISRIGELRIGHNGGGVAVDQHHAVPFFAQRAAGLHAGVIEFAPLPDDNGAGADDQDRMDVGASGHY